MKGPKDDPRYAIWAALKNAAMMIPERDPDEQSATLAMSVLEAVANILHRAKVDSIEDLRKALRVKT
jgi:hypothetical protein